MQQISYSKSSLRQLRHGCLDRLLFADTPDYAKTVAACKMSYITLQHAAEAAYVTYGSMQHMQYQLIGAAGAFCVKAEQPGWTGCSCI